LNNGKATEEKNLEIGKTGGRDRGEVLEKIGTAMENTGSHRSMKRCPCQDQVIRGKGGGGGVCRRVKSGNGRKQ